MLQQKMNDNVKEDIFKSIKDFDDFYYHIINKDDLKLNNDILIKFNKEINIVEIYFKQSKYIVDELTFESIVKEFFQEAEQQNKQGTNKERSIVEERKRNEIIFIGNQIHRLDISYIDYMYEIKMMNAASTYNLYIKKLREIESILNVGDTIIIGSKKIKTIDDFIAFLEEKGFYNIIEDLRQ